MGDTPGRRLNRDRLARWMWQPADPWAGLARTALLPLAGAHAAWMGSRAWAYRRGLRASRDAGLPVMAIGNLSVGGTGKTPLASWAAERCLRFGVRPGVVLRGYGGDETILHRERLPGAIVVAGRDRYRAVRRAAAEGAGVVILDDGFQRLDVARQLNVLLVSAESAAAPRWPLPAGPWRETWSAARRADLAVVTRRVASDEDVARVIDRLLALGLGPTRLAVAELQLTRLTELSRDRTVPRATLRGARVLAACGVADPHSFARQLTALGADVQLVSWPDHHRFDQADLRRLAALGRGRDYVVVTHKDAVKLRDRWRSFGPPALTAHLDVVWHRGEGLLSQLISDLLTSYYTPVMYSAS